MKTHEGIQKVTSENFDHVFAHVREHVDVSDNDTLIFGDMDPIPVGASGPRASGAASATGGPCLLGQPGSPRGGLSEGQSGVKGKDTGDGKDTGGTGAMV